MSSPTTRSPSPGWPPGCSPPASRRAGRGAGARRGKRRPDGARSLGAHEPRDLRVQRGARPLVPRAGRDGLGFRDARSGARPRSKRFFRNLGFPVRLRERPAPGQAGRGGAGRRPLPAQQHRGHRGPLRSGDATSGCRTTTRISARRSGSGASRRARTWCCRCSGPRTRATPAGSSSTAPPSSIHSSCPGT